MSAQGMGGTDEANDMLQSLEQVPGTINDERREQRLLDLVDEWHSDRSLTMPLHQYLGMNLPEYAAWVKKHPHLERQIHGGEGVVKVDLEETAAIVHETRAGAAFKSTGGVYTVARALGCIAAQLEPERGVTAVRDLYRLPGGTSAFPVVLADGRTFYVALLDGNGQPVAAGS